MEAVFQKTQGLNAQLNISLAPEDYQPAFTKALKAQAKSAKVPGFRPGMAPIGMIKKMLGQGFYLNNILDQAYDKAISYLLEEEIRFMAQPLLSNFPEKVNADSNETYQFTFDIGLFPEVNFTPPADITLTHYQVKLSEADLQERIESIRRKASTMDNVEQSEASDVVYLIINELGEDLQPLEGGVSEKNISFTPEMIEDEEVKNLFIGATVGSTFTIDIRKIWNNNESIIAKTLGIQIQGVQDLSNQFKVTIEEVMRPVLAELNTELFVNLTGNENINTEEEFKAEIKRLIENDYSADAMHMIDHEIGHLLQEHLNFELPDAFLRKWLVSQNQEAFKTENIDSVYPSQAFALRQSLLVDKVLEDNNLTVSQQDLEMVARETLVSQFRQYGLNDPFHQIIDSMLPNFMKNKEQVERAQNAARYQLFINHIRGTFNIATQEVTLDEYNSLVEEFRKNHSHEYDHDHEGEGEEYEEVVSPDAENA